MPHIIRRLLFILFVLIFFIVGGLLLFYGSGYRYHFQKKKIEKTAQLVIVSKPKGANVFINNNPPLEWWERLTGKREITTPARVQNILSGEYSIRIEKVGYEPWTGTVFLETGKTTFLDSLVLLPTLQSTPFFSRDDIRSFISFKNGTILIATSKELILIDHETKEQQKILSFQENFSSLLLSPSKKNVLVKTSAHDFVISENAPYFVSEIKSPSRGRYTTVLWDAKDRCIARNNEGIYRITLDKDLKFERLGQGMISDMSVDGATVWFVKVQNTHHTLYSYSDFALPRVKQITEIQDTFHLLEEYQPHLLFFKDTEDHLFLFQQEKKPSSFQPIGFFNQVIQKDTNTFFVQNNFELTKYERGDANIFRPSLLTREGQKIQHMVLFEKIPYIGFLGTDKIFTFLAVNNEDHFQRFSLSGVQEVEDFFYDSERNQVLFQALLNTKKSGLFLYQLTL